MVGFHQIVAERRAKEFYYGDLRHSHEDIERLARSIDEQAHIFYGELREFLLENQWRFSARAAGVVATIITMSAAEKAVLTGVSFLTLFSQTYEIMDTMKKECYSLWEKYLVIEGDRGKLTRMELDNREASYAKCVLENVSPHIYYDSEKDTPWYSGYYTFDMNYNKIEFRMGIGKNF